MAKKYKDPFQADYQGIGQMMSKPDMRRAMETYISVVERAALSLSPVNEERHKGDDKPRYIDSFKVTTGTQQGPPRPHHVNRRAFAQLENTAPHARYVEYGFRGIKKNRVMRKALDVLGPGHGPVVKEKWDH